MNYISDTLYWISTGLLVPVVVLLILFFVRALLLIGGFFGQYLAVRRTEKRLRERLDALTCARVGELAAALPEQGAAPVERCLRRLLEAADSPTLREHLIAEYEIAADQELAASKTLSKLSPMLGLMGTLIPMGPALVGLSTGDIASMAYNMQVAFATTVVGLFSAAIGFVTLQIKQRWFARDLADLEFVAGLLNEKQNAR